MASTHPAKARQTGRRLPSPFRRTVACLILGLLCFQLSQVYLVVPADAFICAAPDHDHGAASRSHDDHDHGEEALEALVANPHDGRNYITHCKDTLDGLGLTPAQPYNTSSAAASQALAKTAVILSSETILPADNNFPPPFQPPRSLS